MQIFGRMIKVRDEQKEALQGCNDVVDYLASRLKWDDETKANALKSNPAITKCNITKVQTDLMIFWCQKVDAILPFYF